MTDIFLSYNREDQARASGQKGPRLAQISKTLRPSP